jgi:hypothetical protein
MIVIRKRMIKLDFKEEFIEKILKDFSPKKIEEKLDLLIERRNIQSPAGWLVAALKNDYQDGQPEDIPTQDSSIPEGRGSMHQAQTKTSRIPACAFPHADRNSTPTKNVIASPDVSEHGDLGNTPEPVSRDKALEAIRLIQDNLSTCISPLPLRKRTRARKNPYSLSPEGRVPE